MRATEAPAVCGACVPQPFWGQTKQPALTSLCKGSQRIGAGGEGGWRERPSHTQNFSIRYFQLLFKPHWVILATGSRERVTVPFRFQSAVFAQM